MLHLAYRWCGRRHKGALAETRLKIGEEVLLIRLREVIDLPSSRGERILDG
jgi:hypothetical protein